MFYALEAGIDYFHVEIVFNPRLINEIVFDLTMYNKNYPCAIDMKELNMLVGIGIVCAIEATDKQNKQARLSFGFLHDERGFGLRFENKVTGFNWRSLLDESIEQLAIRDEKLPEIYTALRRDGVAIPECPYKELKDLETRGYELSTNASGSILSLHHKF